MHFVTDKQTFDDLEIFGAPGTRSLFDRYNKCLTRGGASILKDMLQYPLSDAALINERSATIAFFAERGSAFPFTVRYFSQIEAYLANTDERSRLVGKPRTLKGKIQQWIAPDIETTTILKGIEATVSLLSEVNVFLNTIHIENDHPYSTEYRRLEDLVKAPSLKAVLDVSPGSLDRHYVPLDTILRFAQRDVVAAVLRALYRLDVFFAMAVLAKENGFSYPAAMPLGDDGIDLKDVYHPLLTGAVANTIVLSPSNNTILLTGANMAGKSTLMKTIGIALLLGHAGLPVPAKRMRFSVLDGLYSTINLPDNLRSGASHFFAEVLRVKKIATELAAGKKLFVVFDEMFRGTNVKDAYDATLAIVKGFAAQPAGFFLISTHIVEVAPELVRQCSNVFCIYLPTTMDGAKPVYTYRFLPGVSDDRHGMLIIRNEGILEMLEAGRH
jgi:DNA mismatch repair ATPase MutS